MLVIPQVQFISFALGGSKKYGGKSMVEAHKNLEGLQIGHFNAVKQYLAEALEELDVSKVEDAPCSIDSPEEA